MAAHTASPRRSRRIRCKVHARPQSSRGRQPVRESGGGHAPRLPQFLRQRRQGGSETGPSTQLSRGVLNPAIPSKSAPQRREKRRRYPRARRRRTKTRGPTPPPTWPRGQRGRRRQRECPPGLRQSGACEGSPGGTVPHSARTAWPKGSRRTRCTAPHRKGCLHRGVRPQGRGWRGLPRTPSPRPRGCLLRGRDRSGARCPKQCDEWGRAAGSDQQPRRPRRLPSRSEGAPLAFAGSRGATAPLAGRTGPSTMRQRTPRRGRPPLDRCRPERESPRGRRGVPRRRRPSRRPPPQRRRPTPRRRGRGPGRLPR